MKYLLTGGAGFIGSHLAEALLEKQEQVQSSRFNVQGSMFKATGFREFSKYRSEAPPTKSVAPAPSSARRPKATAPEGL